MIGSDDKHDGLTSNRTVTMTCHTESIGLFESDWVSGNRLVWVGSWSDVDVRPMVGSGSAWSIYWAVGHGGMIRRTDTY